MPRSVSLAKRIKSKPVCRVYPCATPVLTVDHKNNFISANSQLRPQSNRTKENVGPIEIRQRQQEEETAQLRKRIREAFNRKY